MSASTIASLLLLEPARPSHARDMRCIDSKVYPTPWSANLWRRELARPAADACYVAASHGGRHVGHGGLMVQADDGHIVTVAVDPAEQRSGVASHIMAALLARAVRLGLDALTLEVRHSNRPAQSLYRRFGFAPAGIRPAYYADDAEDALVMWAHGVSEPAFRDRLDAVASGLGPASIHPALTRLIALPTREDIRR